MDKCITKTTRNKALNLAKQLAAMWLLTTVAQGAQHASLSWNKFHPVCKLGAFLTKVPAEAKRQTAAALEQLKAAGEAENHARLAALARSDLNAFIVYAATAAAADECTNITQNKLATITADAIDPIETSTKMTGCIAEMVVFLKAALKCGSTTGYCFSTGSHKSPIKDTTIDGIDCEKFDHKLRQDRLEFGSDVITSTGFARLNIASLFSSQNSKCTLLEKWNSDTAAAADVFQTNGPHTLLNGILDLTASAPAAKIQDKTKIAANWHVSSARTAADKLYNAL
uniref:Variant surface glycoprotein 1125.1557 n=1 Tax=Trypanosoma brucei TaxID=5691 RepID=A0A1J0R784_9TRYP|nr:variant surface glycoprotein 1125.1557 [Trypanosoma brucei]